MGFYDRHILPKVLNWSCGMKPVQKQRQKVVRAALRQSGSLPVRVFASLKGKQARSSSRSAPRPATASG
ncbi:MAG: hypothetical protein IH856_15555 [Deltaproteobacteria bacterium]|nr:hypothetical protein [Deltaproteobacteria bacterium]